MNVVIDRSQPRNTKKMRKTYYFLYWREEDVYLTKASLRPKYMWPKRLLESTIRFSLNPGAGWTRDIADFVWREYEFMRRKNNLLPKLEIVEGVMQTSLEITRVVKSEISDVDIIYKEIGKTLGEAMAGIPEGFKPATAVKRKGKTSGICRNLTDSVVEKGVFTFFADDADATLAKIALGDKYVREYDIAGTIERFRNEAGSED